MIADLLAIIFNRIWRVEFVSTDKIHSHTVRFYKGSAWAAIKEANKEMSGLITKDDKPVGFLIVSVMRVK